MRKKAPDGLTTIERAILTRLKKGPAALSSLAHAARCKSASIKVHISRLRKKLPPGTTIPRSFFGAQTYHLEQDGQKSQSRNNIWYAAGSLPDYTLCEWLLDCLGVTCDLAQATMLRSWYNCGAKSGTLWRAIRLSPPLPVRGRG